MEEKIVIDETDIIDINLEIARKYLAKASYSSKKEEKIKNMLIAQNTINKSLAIAGFKQ